MRRGGSRTTFAFGKERLRGTRPTGGEGVIEGAGESEGVEGLG